MSKPFNSDNFEGTEEQIKKLNEAYAMAAEEWFEGVNPEDVNKIKQMHKSLCDRIGNVFSDGLSAAEIAIWANQR